MKWQMLHLVFQSVFGYFIVFYLQMTFRINLLSLMKYPIAIMTDILLNP